MAIKGMTYFIFMYYIICSVCLCVTVSTYVSLTYTFILDEVLSNSPSGNILMGLSNIVLIMRKTIK